MTTSRIRRATIGVALGVVGLGVGAVPVAAAPTPPCVFTCTQPPPKPAQCPYWYCQPRTVSAIQGLVWK